MYVDDRTLKRSFFLDTVFPWVLGATAVVVVGAGANLSVIDRHKTNYLLEASSPDTSDARRKYIHERLQEGHFSNIPFYHLVVNPYQIDDSTGKRR